MNINDRNPDVEVTFYFNGSRKTPICDGYRPAHLVKDDYLTTGVHHYFCNNPIQPDGTTEGTITFLTPEVYPKCLHIGKKIQIQEGERVVGYAVINKILNPILEE